MKSFGRALIQITLILLKAFNFIDWSWIWVFFPMWIGLAILGLFFVGAFIVFLIGAIFGSKRY